MACTSGESGIVAHSLTYDGSHRVSLFRNVDFAPLPPLFPSAQSTYGGECAPRRLRPCRQLVMALAHPTIDDRRLVPDYSGYGSQVGSPHALMHSERSQDLSKCRLELIIGRASLAR
eukprot:scaffold274353_cov30-Tisochrysis_lutea.AAC.1